MSKEIEELIKQDLEQNKLTFDELLDQSIEDIKSEKGFARRAQYAGSSSLTGIAQDLEELGFEFVDVDEEELLMYRDLADIASEDNPVLGFLGDITGGAMDIVGGPISLAGKVVRSLSNKGLQKLGRDGLDLDIDGQTLRRKRGAAVEFGTSGAAAGYVEPILTEEDSQALNVGAGLLFGGALGTGLAALGRKTLGDGTFETPEELPAEQLRIGMDAQPERIGREERLGIGFQDSNEGKRVPRVGTERTGLGTVEAGMDRPVTPVRGAKGPVTEEPEFNPVAIVQKELEQKAKARINRKQAKQTQSELNNLTKALNELNNKRVKRGPQYRKIEAQKAKIKQQLEAKRKILEADAEARLAQKELTRIANKQLSPITAQRVAKLGERRPLVAGIRQAQEQMEPRLLDEVQPRTSEAEARVTEAPKPPPPEPEYPNVAGQVETPMRTGFEPADPRQSMGAAGVRPVQANLPEAQEGVDADALRASIDTSRKVPMGERQTKRMDQGLDRTPMQQQRARARAQASTRQLEELAFGVDERQTQADIDIAYQKLKAEVGEEYNNMLDWALETFNRQKFFAAHQRRLFEDLLVQAEATMRERSSQLISLKRRGQLDTVEAVEAFQDIEMANYIMNIDFANKKNVGRALRDMRVGNARRKAAMESYKKGGKKSLELFVMGVC